eukprot:Em0005g388a
MICPNTAVNYTCNVGSFAGVTLWNVPSVGECSGSTLILAQGPPGPRLSCLTSSSSGTCGPFTVTNTPPLTSNVYCLTSTLSMVVTSAMNGLVVSCSTYSISSFITTPVGNATISVVAAPSAPAITSLISTYLNQLTVTWTSVPTATSYNVSINASVNTLVPIPSTGAPQYTFTGLTNNTDYTVSVVAINCAGSSSPATMTNRTTGPCITAVGSSIGTAVGVSVSVTFVVSFSMGVLVAYVLCYISRRSKESSHKPDSPATVHDVGTNKKIKGDAMEMDANTAYGSHVSSTVYDEPQSAVMVSVDDGHDGNLAIQISSRQESATAKTEMSEEKQLRCSPILRLLQVYLHQRQLCSAQLSLLTQMPLVS